MEVRRYFMSVVLLLFVVALGCTQVNTQSKDHYDSKRTFRHGIVPVPVPASKDAAGDKKFPKVDNKSVALGKVLYKQNCYSCHGINGQGDGPRSVDQETIPVNLIDMARKVPNFNFYMMVSQWQNEMPGWQNVLSPKEITDIKNYIIHLAQTTSAQ
ncbi:MAG: cytochrome c [Halobacteriovoraceae bacterium]|jgi:mono/diheme cytochrome c family protein|nr:cytochrome c [Halobacteriovoraceae bacterium]